MGSEDFGDGVGVRFGGVGMVGVQEQVLHFLVVLLVQDLVVYPK
jgi:hypothetical protein